MGPCDLTILFLLISNAASESDWKLPEIDFIVVGAGAAGAALAARLSEDPDTQVVLIEAGGEEPPYVTQIPYFSVGPFRGEVDWNFSPEKQESAFLSFNDHKFPWPRGKGLGGSTLINAMFFTRGSRHDYDYWASMGNEGWDYQSVLPYFLKMEDYQVPLRHKSDASYHSQNGPVTVSVPPYKTPLADAFLEAGKELGYDVVDYHAKTMTGVSNPVFSIRNGTRWSTNEAYIKPARKRPNFHIITRAIVTKVVIDENRRAAGVVFIKDGTEREIKSKKEVILSAGALSSPHILMLSGIGPKKMLDTFQIPVVADLPGVGENLQDHVSVFALSFSVDRNVGFKYGGEATPETMELWERKRKGPLTVPVRCEGISFLHSKYSDPKEDYPDVEIIISQPPLPPLPMDPEEFFRGFSPEYGKDLFWLLPVVMRPKSVGYLALQSDDPLVPPIFQPKYLTHPDDVKVLIEGIKIALRLADTDAFKQYGVKWFGKKLPGCEDFNDFADFDDNYWECIARHYTFPYYHQSGTCKMGPETDKMAVVDSYLKVHGISGLRVADISISPRIITGHTMAPAIMIGEKAADMIKEEWKDR